MENEEFSVKRLKIEIRHLASGEVIDLDPVYGNPGYIEELAQKVLLEVDSFISELNGHRASIGAHIVRGSIITPKAEGVYIDTVAVIKDVHGVSTQQKRFKKWFEVGDTLTILVEKKSGPMSTKEPVDYVITKATRGDNLKDPSQEIELKSNNLL